MAILDQLFNFKLLQLLNSDQANQIIRNRLKLLVTIHNLMYHLLNAIQLKGHEVKIGIIGAGVVGKLVLDLLLQKIQPKQIQVSTRRPELLNKYELLGVQSYFDNNKLAVFSDIIVCCFPPSFDHHIYVDLNKELTELNDPRIVISTVSNFTEQLVAKIMPTQYTFLIQLDNETIQKIESQFVDECLLQLQKTQDFFQTQIDQTLVELVHLISFLNFQKFFNHEKCISLYSKINNYENSVYNVIFNRSADEFQSEVESNGQEQIQKLYKMVFMLRANEILRSK